MKLNSDVLFDAIGELADAERLGPDITSLTLSRPLFLSRDIKIEPGKVYVGQSNQLSMHPEVPGSLIVVLGRPPKRWTPRRSSVISIEDESLSLFDVFNCIQATYDHYDAWSDDLARCLQDDADLPELLRLGVTVFKNTISVVDSQLDVEYCCTCDASDLTPRFLERDPKSISKELEGVRGRRAQDNRRKEPFLVDVISDTGAQLKCYNHNVFKHSTYLATVSLTANARPFRKSDFELFDFFAGYVADAVVLQSNFIDGRLITWENVFSDLVGGLPVSDAIIEKAFSRKDTGSALSDSWVSVAVQNTGEYNEFPHRFVANQVKEAFPDTVSLNIDDELVLFVRLGDGGAGSYDAFCDGLASVMGAIKYCAGVSGPFSTVRQARQYYLQAHVAVNVGREFDDEAESLYRFDDQVLRYMLSQSMHEILPEFLLPRTLVTMYRDSRDGNGVDEWETLLVYLRNECNLSKTARELYLHRSTLQNRLTNITKSIDISTPEKRLYIRNCMYLYEMIYG